jgi:hypothetical protein
MFKNGMKIRIEAEECKEQPIVDFNQSIKISLAVEKAKERLDSTKKKEDFRMKTISKIMKQIAQFDLKTETSNVVELPISSIRSKRKELNSRPLSDRQHSDAYSGFTHERIATDRSKKSTKRDTRS